MNSDNYFWIANIDFRGYVEFRTLKIFSSSYLSKYRTDYRKNKHVALGSLNKLRINDVVCEDYDLLTGIFYLKNEEITVSEFGPCKLTHVYDTDEFKIYWKDKLEEIHYPNNLFKYYKEFLNSCKILNLEIPEYLIKNK